MKEFSIKELTRIIKAHERRAMSDERRFFTRVSTDSRTTQTGDCFFAIPGDNFDGHDYVLDAFSKGAVCAVVNKNFKDTKLPPRAILKVEDTVKALGDFAKQYRQQSNFKVVAITGSVGKTTTRQIVYNVLSQHYRAFQAPKNFNNNIGLPLTLLAAKPEDKIIIAELGSNHPGEIAYLTRIAQPDIAVVINVYPAHLEGFGDLQTIIHEKLSISEGLRPPGTLIINTNLVKWLNNHKSQITNYQIITFGKSDQCDIQAHNITHNASNSRFTIDGTEILLPLPGQGNVENALAAWSVCSRFGINIDDFAHALKTLPAIPMRTELMQIGTLTVLNDCYNANPASMKNALDILTRLAFYNKSQNGIPPNLNSTEKRRLVFICGDMAELGEQTKLLHNKLGTSIAQAKVQLLLTVGKFAKIAAEAAKRKVDYHLQAECFEDTFSACNNLHKLIKDYDIILIKGSRVARLEMTIEKLKELFL